MKKLQYNDNTYHEQLIAMGNNEELANYQLLQVSKFYIFKSNAFVVLTKKYMEILRKYA
jgi:hypothetical protein